MLCKYPQTRGNLPQGVPYPTLWAQFGPGLNGAASTALLAGTGPVTATRASSAYGFDQDGKLVSLANDVLRGMYDPTPPAGKSGYFLQCPAVSGVYVSTPNAAPVRLQGRIGLRLKCSLVDWTPSTSPVGIAKLQSGTQRSFRFYPANATGSPFIEWSLDGSTTLSAVATSAVAYADGDIGDLFVDLTPNNGAGGSTVRFYTSVDDGTSWAQLGTTVVGVTPGNIFDSTSIIEIASSVGGSSTLLNGRVYRAQIYSGGLGGTLVADFNPANGLQAAASITSTATGEVWTMNGGAQIYAKHVYAGAWREGAATNEALRSIEYDNATWLAIGVKNVTANSALGPDGALSCDIVADNSAAAYEGIQQNLVVANDSAVRVVSVVVKKSYSATNSFGLNLVLNGGAPTVTAIPRLNMTTGATQNGGFSKLWVTPFGEFWHFWVPIVNNSSGNTAFSIAVYPAPATWPAADSVAATGSATLWNVQSEVISGTLGTGAHPSTPIVSGAAAGTRSADLVSVPSAGNVTNNGTGSAVLVAYPTNLTNINKYALAINTNGSNFVAMGITTSNPFGLVWDGGVQQASLSDGGTFAAAWTRMPLGISWGANDFAFYSQGVQRSTDVAGSVPAFTTIEFGADWTDLQPLNGGLTDVMVWNGVKLSQTQFSRFG